MPGELWDDFSSLPVEAQRQVADFIAFLRQRYHRPVPARRPLSGGRGSLHAVTAADPDSFDAHYLLGACLGTLGQMGPVYAATRELPVWQEHLRATSSS